MTVIHKYFNLHKCDRGVVLFLLLIAINFAGCKKLIEIEPSLSQPSSSIVYNNDATAASVLTGIYSEFASNSTVNGNNGLSIIGGLTADELKIASATQPILQSAYTNTFQQMDNIPFWSRFYYYIYTTNSVLENLEKSPAISIAVKQQLRGEARFVRAFSYFYLVNLFGDVPLILSTDYRINAKASRTSKEKVWQQIIVDLKEAKNLLNPKYVESDGVTVKPSTEKVRPNSFVATSLLARAYLYTGDWVNAEASATEVINNTVYTLESSLNNVFLKTSKEAIWQIQGNQTNVNTYEGNVFVLTAPPDFSSPATLSNFILNAFEAGDNRRILWVDSIIASGSTYYFANKYKVKQNSIISEYLVLFRLGEQYLIRAEARAQLNKIAESKSDLNVIRNRAGLANTSAIDKSSVLTAIQNERRIELFTELGHRWLDLKRTGLVDAVMTTVSPDKGGTWNTNWQLLPIPYYSAILPNSNIQQNPGY
jgi:hypothetical protein